MKCLSLSEKIIIQMKCLILSKKIIKMSSAVVVIDALRVKHAKKLLSCDMEKSVKP